MNDMTVDEREKKVRKVNRKYKFANVKKRCKWSQTVANGRKWSQTVEHGRKQSQMATTDRKGSQKVASVANVTNVAIVAKAQMS